MSFADDVCLAMLVRDEAVIIQRCLASLQDHVSSYYIIDTGSTDDTPDLIEQALDGLPGCVVRQPFSSFGLLRESLYQEAGKRADHVLFVDADETLKVTQVQPVGMGLPDVGLLDIDFQTHTCKQSRLFRKQLDIGCIGHVYEQPVYHQVYRPEHISGFSLINHQDGFRSRQVGQSRADMTDLLAELGSGQRDAEILLQLAKLAYPHESANVFLRDCIAATDNQQTQWQAYYWLGKAIRQQGGDLEIAITSFMHAYEIFAERAEPLHCIIACLNESGKTEAAKSLAEVAASIELPVDADYFEAALYANKSAEKNDKQSDIGTG